MRRNSVTAFGRKIVLPALVLMTLAGCAQTAEVTPLGPRASKWAGSEGVVRTGWGGLEPDNLLRSAISNQLQAKGISTEDGSPKKFLIWSIPTKENRSYFEKHPWVVSDFIGDKKEFVGNDQRCFIMIGGDRDISSISITYEWDESNLDYDTLHSCMNFFLNK